MVRCCYGIILGRSIELANDPGMPYGQAVRVVVSEILGAPGWGEGILRSAGALADCPEFDAVFEQIERERKNSC